jgi:cyanophycinase
VIVVKNPKEIKKAPKNHLVSIKSLEMSVLIEGQKFNIQ